MQNITQVFRAIRETTKLPNSLQEIFQSSNCAQQAALATRLVKRGIAADSKWLRKYLDRTPEVAALIAAGYPGILGKSASCTSRNLTPLEIVTCEICRRTNRNRVIGQELLRRFVTEFVSGQISPSAMAVWLVIVCEEGLSASDIKDLTFEMRDSGEVYDYRDDVRLRGRKLVRRYPTGAVSEKVALILPSLISGTRAVVPIASTFLVAKSLGFTGGTWDKLRAIPGFRFPKPGKETLDIIEKSAVAMTVTQESFNPADRKMYQLRSVTGTIESIELIAASIASKQMALPADHLLLDVRYGPGAFVEKLADAHALAELIVSLLKSEGLLCTFNMTDTQQPTGSAIGNALEVAEAIEVMKNEGNQCPWDRRSIKAQQEIVLGLWGAMLRPLFPEGVVDKYNTLGRQFIFNGMLQRAFAELLEVHGVSRYDITKLVTDPLTTLTQGCECITVCSSRKGIFSSVDQRRLGYFVNFSLGGGGNDYAGDFDSRAGVLLAKRLGDSVAMGEPIARIYVPRETFDAAWLADETRECLEIV